MIAPTEPSLEHPDTPPTDLARRAMLQMTGTGIAVLGVSAALPSATLAATPPHLERDWDKTFPKSGRVDHQKLTFKNRYGIVLAADLYRPRKAKGERLPALVVGGPFGAVKEQASGLYAQTLAERGFITLAFDPSFTGESGGETRNVASADINTEDFSAAIDFLGLQPYVDRERIGVVGICGFSGMALTAATSDSRIKALATASMYDMSRSMSRGYKDSYTPEQRHAVIDYLSQQRWADAELGKPALGYHEVPFDAHGNIIEGQRVLPDTLPNDPDPVLAAFFDYYRTPRGFHRRSVNSSTAWTATTPVSFFNFPMHANLDMIAPRPLLLVAGEHAHSRYYSEDVYNAASGPKQLLIVPGADHVDLYDRSDKIPFDALTVFFQKHLT
ncbi:alpha/beta hydrolase [Pseudomonas sp.]|uniref:alpha/beta hydrolase n=1 Tax=Pseudomonas sp. TaxID=306 RepID=UPI0028AD9CF7|nr:alpha/beta hydrolase [Pseudomonas sp.]